MEKSNNFDINELVKVILTRPAPESCSEIDELLSTLPAKSSFMRKTATPQQQVALKQLEEKLLSPTVEELRYAAEVCSAKYHRIRPDGDWSCFEFDRAKELYKKYYQLTGCEEVKYILEHFDEYIKKCVDSESRRQYRDDTSGYPQTLSTSRDPDSEEWKK